MSDEARVSRACKLVLRAALVERLILILTFSIRGHLVVVKKGSTL